MTGIEQLRKLGADAVRGGDIGRAICDIADQIERERECERDTIENLRLELGEARDEAAWVREHGGLYSVKKLLDWVVGHCSTKEQLDFDFWLSGRVMHELGFEEDRADRDEVERRLLDRLMPEGTQWPCFEDGEPVRIGDVVSDVEVRSVVFRDGGILLSDCTSVPGWGTWRSYKEPIKRPAPKVLDADGAEIRVGDTVYHVKDGSEMTVYGIEGEWLVVSVGGRVRHDIVTRRAPVLAADGKPLRDGETVWYRDHIDPLEVRGISTTDSGAHYVKAYNDYEGEVSAPAECFTHERPESWERLMDDATQHPWYYCKRYDIETDAVSPDADLAEVVTPFAQDLVRRAKALAERDAK